MRAGGRACLARLLHGWMAVSLVRWVTGGLSQGGGGLLQVSLKVCRVNKGLEVNVSCITYSLSLSLSLSHTHTHTGLSLFFDHTTELIVLEEHDIINQFAIGTSLMICSKLWFFIGPKIATISLNTQKLNNKASLWYRGAYGGDCLAAVLPCSSIATVGQDECAD